MVEARPNHRLEVSGAPARERDTAAATLAAPLHPEHLKAVLSKVTIGGQGGTDALLLHENEARRVSEGEILVLVAINKFLCLLHVCGSYLQHGCRGALKLA